MRKSEIDILRVIEIDGLFLEDFNEENGKHLDTPSLKAATKFLGDTDEEVEQEIQRTADIFGGTVRALKVTYDLLEAD